jgi:hypothetical protein
MALGKQRIHYWGRDKLLSALLWSAAIALATAAIWVLLRESAIDRDDDSMIVRKFAVLEEKVKELELDREADRARIAELEARSLPAPLPALKTAPAPPPAPRRVAFVVGVNHQRELLPGISLRLTDTDVARQSFGGLLTVRGGRVMAVREQRIQQPFPLSGKERVVATRVTRYSVLGYVSTRIQ